MLSSLCCLTTTLTAASIHACRVEGFGGMCSAIARPHPAASRSWPRSRPRAMCKPRAATGSDALASQPAAAASSRRSSSSKRRAPAAGAGAAAAASSSSPSTSYGPDDAGTASGQRRGATSSSSTSSASSSRASLAAARASLPDPPVLYPFQELAAATNSFLARRSGGSASAAYWRCALRGRDAALFQLPRRPDGGGPALDAAALARVGRYHHTGLARLLGACPAGAHVYLAYELPPGAATLAACLRGPRNPSFTALRTWVSRVQVAADVAQGLEYVHHHAGAVHGRVSPHAVLVSDPGLRARLTHLGAAEFAAPADAREAGESPYAAPDSAAPSREADVYAFGVLLLELLSGEEPARYRFDRGTKEFQRVSVLETAAAAAAGGGVRNWVDRRLGDSFPVAAAERLVEVALRCAAAAAEDRPDMTWVAGKVSKVYLESRAWEQKVQLPTEFSVSVAPR